LPSSALAILAVSKACPHQGGRRTSIGDENSFWQIKDLGV
jgi:hypothetical protein